MLRQRQAPPGAAAGSPSAASSSGASSAFSGAASRALLLGTAARRGAQPGGRSRSSFKCMAWFSEMSSFANLLTPERATVFTAMIAAGSVATNLWGGLLTERKRAEFAKEVDRERTFLAGLSEVRSIVARYRGPLLEASVDLEQRLHHLLAATGEWSAVGRVAEEEVVYTVFTLAQFLGFLEVVRREGPRERSFLQPGNAQGTDTLATLMEGLRFVLCARSSQLQRWYDEGTDPAATGPRLHPGARARNVPEALRRAAAAAAAAEEAEEAAARDAASAAAAEGTWPPPVPTVHDGSNGAAAHAAPAAPTAMAATDDRDGAGSSHSDSNGASSGGSGLNGASGNAGPSARPRALLHISRGVQRALGGLMLITPMGAARQYTLSYADFYARFQSDSYFRTWFQPLYDDVLALVSGPRWGGRAPFPVHAWSRALLLQQLLVDTIDMLDPSGIRLAHDRRLRLAPVEYTALPNAESYKARLREMEDLVTYGGHMLPPGGAGPAMMPPGGPGGGAAEGLASYYSQLTPQDTRERKAGGLFGLFGSGQGRSGPPPPSLSGGSRQAQLYSGEFYADDDNGGGWGGGGWGSEGGQPYNQQPPIPYYLGEGERQAKRGEGERSQERARGRARESERGQ